LYNAECAHLLDARHPNDGKWTWPDNVPWITNSVWMRSSCVSDKKNWSREPACPTYTSSVLWRDKEPDNWGPHNQLRCSFN
jgi:hypothetical protein